MLSKKTLCIYTISLLFMVLYVNRQLYTANCQTSDTSLLDTASPGHSEGVPTDNVTGIVCNNNIPGTSVQGSGTGSILMVICCSMCSMLFDLYDQQHAITASR